MNQFSKKTQECLELGKRFAASYGQGLIGSEHILMGILAEGNNIAAIALKKHGVELDTISEMVSKMMNPNTNVNTAETGGYTPRALAVLKRSVMEAGQLNSSLVATEHVLLAILKMPDSVAYRILVTLKVNLRKLYLELYMLMGQEPVTEQQEEDYPSPGEFLDGIMAGGRRNRSKGEKESKTPTLDQFSRDLTALAAKGKLDPVVGRSEEIGRVIQILSRRTKNNPCLIGEPGVGKTAIAEGLAIRISEGNIPETIQNKRVVTLDLSGMVAGTKYRGEFEERIKNVIDEVVEAGDVLLFIDEIHTIIGAGGAEGAMDAANILKPALARGELQIIGATTITEYRKNIEKDAALERRFQPVMVEEPSEEETVEILKGLRHAYEDHHRVTITDGALLAAVKLSSRYINDRFLPDKAIDLIDEASSKVRLSAYVTPPEVRELEEKKKELSARKEEAISREAYEEAKEIKLMQEDLEKKIREEKEAWERFKNEQSLTVDEEDIADVVSAWTKIPVKTLREDEMVRLRKLEEILHERVIGQEEAVKAVSRAIRRGRVGIKDVRRPIGSFLFLGPTGVGKTELCKALSEALFGDENSVIRVDMSEYMESHSVSKMIGSPPGYVGYDEGGQLSEKVRRHPYSIVLFDEVEKAHPDVFNLLLQVLDEGRITDSQGRRVDFKNTVIIMTSNIGAQNIISPKTLGFGTQYSSDEEKKEADYASMKERVMGDVKKTFRPEFINRIDEVIVFHPLVRSDMRGIIEVMLAGIRKNLKSQQNLELLMDDAAKEWLIDRGFDEKFGARPLRRTLQTELEDKLAELFLEEVIHPGDTISVTTDEEKKQLKFTTDRN